MRIARSGSALVLVALLAACSTHVREPRPAPTLQVLTVDSHVDIPDLYMREPRFDAGTDSHLRVDLAKMRRGGLDAAFFVVYVGQGPLTATGYAQAVAAAERKYSAIELLVERNRDRIALATSPADVRANHARGVLSAMIGIENGYSLGHDLDRIDAAHARGARYLGLVHVGNNDICTSSQPNVDLGEPVPATHGISTFGREVVRRANALGMMVDVSHASDACVRDVLAMTRVPVIASHSSARALIDHPRNLPDDLLRAIAANGGVVQAVAYKEFLKVDPGRKAAEKLLETTIAEQLGVDAFDSDVHGMLPAYLDGMRHIEQQFPLATLEDLLDHVEHIAKIAGIDHVGIASDFDGGGALTGWMDASETHNVTAGLRRRGFDDAEIAKIWSGNLLRAWQAVESAAQR